MAGRRNFDYLLPPVAPHVTAGVRSRASKHISAGAMMISSRAPTWNATIGVPSAVHDGVAAQAIVPDQATHAAIAAAQVSPHAVAARTSQRVAISNVQSALAAHGHDPGSTNGELDYATRSALKSFQSSNGLPVTGTIDAATHAAVTSDLPRRAGGNVIPSGGAIMHTLPKGLPVVRISPTSPPISPADVPTAGTAHPVQTAPRSTMMPAKPAGPPVSFGNTSHNVISPVHPIAGAGNAVPGAADGASSFDKYNNGSNPSGQTRTNWSGATGVSSGKAGRTHGSMQLAGPSGGPPQGSGAVAGGTQSVAGFHGNASAGNAGSTAGRVAGFRPGGSAGRKAQGGHPSSQSHTGGMTNMASKGGTKGWRSTGWRICLVLTATIAGAASANISVNPQMDFRGENLVIDSTTVGPSSTLTIPAIGTIPQIAGGTASTAVPGTLFSPAQAGALDFKMSIANQGNAVQFTANNTNTTVSLAFAALLFGTEVEMDQGGMTSGVAPAGSYAGG